MGLRGRSHFGTEGHEFFVTTTVVNFARVFAEGEPYYEILADALRFQLKEQKAKLLAYVFMPSHVHLIVTLPEGTSLSDFMRDFKKYTSTKIRQQLERDGKDHTVKSLKRNAKGKRNQVFKLWMDRFDDLMIENDGTLIRKLDYIHNNPVKAGLVDKVENWKYSSAPDYTGRKDGPLPVFTNWYDD
ncbi:MAG TPA: transposase [Bacteroidota bacterium]